MLSSSNVVRMLCLFVWEPQEIFHSDGNDHGTTSNLKIIENIPSFSWRSDVGIGRQSIRYNNKLLTRRRRSVPRKLPDTFWQHRKSGIGFPPSGDLLAPWEIEVPDV